MSKKFPVKESPAVPVTRDAVIRTMKAVAPKFGGRVPVGSYVGALQAAEESNNRRAQGAGSSQRIAPPASQQANTSPQDNRSKQLNPEHDVYWQSRGKKARPADWSHKIQAKPGI